MLLAIKEMYDIVLKYYFFVIKYFYSLQNSHTFASLFKKSILKKGDLVAQLVEQYTFNVWALGSNPSQITKHNAKL